jgi:hypothetical protein
MIDESAQLGAMCLRCGKDREEPGKWLEGRPSANADPVNGGTKVPLLGDGEQQRQQVQVHTAPPLSRIANHPVQHWLNTLYSRLRPCFRQQPS